MAEWRYLFLSKVRHYFPDAGWKSINDNSSALCGTMPSWFSIGWHGTGNQTERDHIRTLRPCVLCVRKGAPVGPMTDD